MVVSAQFGYLSSISFMPLCSAKVLQLTVALN